MTSVQTSSPVGSKKPCWERKHISILLITLQLMLLSWLTFRYNLEPGLHIHELILATTVGFVFQFAFPLKHRLTLFLLFGLFSLFWFLGWKSSGILLLIFLLFFSILQLRVSISWRAAILCLFGTILGIIWAYYPSLLIEGHRIIPIVGSILMFRSFVYLHETRFQKERPSVVMQLTYFLLLPNYFITLFPVIDYKLFQKTYASEYNVRIHQKGVRLLVRGFLHLMLYRLIYYYYQPNIDHINSLGQVVHYVVTTYLLILRLSGLFHTSGGVICLFGFDLPPLFHNYFLANSFSDVWRRINTYWKDFVTKVLYYPIYFRLRHLGGQKAMFISIILVFIISWWLHSYQWFWLKGTFPIRAVDAIFWITWGLAVAVNGLIQQSRSAQQRRTTTGGFRNTLLKSLSIVGMFAFMSIFWALWSSPTIAQWWELVVIALSSSALEWSKVCLALVLFTSAVFVGTYLFDHNAKLRNWLEPTDGSPRSMLNSGLTLATFVFFSIPGNIRFLQPILTKPAEDLYEAKLNQYDSENLIRGYYEDLLVENQYTSPLSEVRQEPADWKRFNQTKASKETGDWRFYELNPGQSANLKHAQFTVNKDGIRDRLYTFEKPENTYRILILGGSYVAGSGVEDHLVFDQVCEQRLDSLWTCTPELINFAVPAYHLMHNLYQLQNKVINYEADALFLVSHGVEVARMIDGLDRLKMTNHQPPFEQLGINTSELVPDTTEQFSQKVGQSRAYVEACYQKVADHCIEHGLKPYILYWPRTEKDEIGENKDYIFTIARRHGFQIVDFDHIYDNVDSKLIQLAPWDKHPNEVGHRILADALTAYLSSQEFRQNLPDCQRK